MQPTTNNDYTQLLTEVIKKQIVILGPDITLSKARNVKGLTVANDGTVTEVTGNPQEIIQSLIDQFVQLSGLIVKKTMEPLLSIAQPSAPVIQTPLQQPVMPMPPAQPIPNDAAQALINQAAQQVQPQQPLPVVNPLAQPANPTNTGSVQS